MSTPRPIRTTERRNWCSGPQYGLGYRLPRLRKAHGDDEPDINTNAIGFVNVASYGDEYWELKNKSKVGR